MASLAAARVDAESAPLPAASDRVDNRGGGAETGADVIEPDARAIPWATLHRLALEAGQFLPPYRPVTVKELLRPLLAGSRQDDFAGGDADEQRLLAYWLDDLQRGPLITSRSPTDSGTGAIRWCLGGRAALAYDPLGAVVVDQSGWQLAPGLSLALEPDAAVRAGRWWGAVTARATGRVVAASGEAPAALLYLDWPQATGRPPTGEARLSRGAWVVDWPRGIAGVQLGNWSLTAGWAPRQVGPGRAGGLTLAGTAPSFPAVTARRTAPFDWRGLFDWIDPDHLLARVGRLSAQTVRWQDEYGAHERRDEPWFFQWLISWNHTSWLRTTFTHAAIAVPRSGSLWGDVLQINFPLLSATWDESDRGPVTDRIASLQFEARFRNAPWPLLPATAGRIYWEYGGEDFNPSNVLPSLPRISAPASVVGLELLSPRWDLVVEYAELRHPTVLWYSNTGFTAGYAHHGFVVGFPDGGAAESWTMLVRWRPRSRGWEWELGGRWSGWAMPERLRDEAEHWLGFGRWRRTYGRLRWELGADWWRETVWPAAEPDSRVRDDRVALYAGISF